MTIFPKKDMNWAKYPSDQDIPLSGVEGNLSW